MTAPLRVALLGYGLAGRVIHAPLIAAVPGLALTDVVTSDPGRRDQVADDLPGVRLHATADDLLAAGATDLVVVATGNAAHVPLARAALRAGLPTVVDKPLAVTEADAASLVALAQDLGVPLGVFHNRRWDSDTLSAQQVLAGGVLGTVHRLEARFTRFRPEVQQRWREDPTAGGGVLLDLGTHLVDQARLLLGEVAEVYAEVDVRRRGATADDDVFLALTHTSGARSHLWCSAAAPWTGPRLVLQGDRGGWSKHTLDNQEDALRAGLSAAGDRPAEPPSLLHDVDGTRETPSLPGDWPAFYRGVEVALRTGSPLPVPAGEALPVLRVLEAARESARTRSVVAVSAVSAAWPAGR